MKVTVKSEYLSFEDIRIFEKNVTYLPIIILYYNLILGGN